IIFLVRSLCNNEKMQKYLLNNTSMAKTHGYATKPALTKLLYTWTKKGAAKCPIKEKRSPKHNIVTIVT
ncbi:MAG: hypothetical protein ABJA71_09925, partial [Ginsengibacter sp.]